ncbi:hypothetical protein EQ500_14025, partial [Lactobacillus sp. XV13L]|nr:hypothetical protein [Lactobacillus sp. XV13L]
SQIILSKGHAAAALYATLFIKKILNEKPSDKYGCKDSLLLGHPNDKIRGIPYATGSLGHGIGYAAGWSLGQYLSNKKGISVVIGGDGELQEGSVWEALQVISSKKISNNNSSSSFRFMLIRIINLINVMSVYLKELKSKRLKSCF